MIPAGLVETIHQLEEILDRLALRRSYGGAIACNFWAPPRFTHDVDLLVLVPDLKAPALVEALSKEGFQHRDPPAEPLDLRRFLADVRAKSHLTVLVYRGVPTEIFVPWHPFHHRVLDRSPERDLQGRRIRIHTAEDLIVFKKVFDRPKDPVDIEALLEAQRGNLDLDRLLSDAQAFLSHESWTLLATMVDKHRP